MKICLIGCTGHVGYVFAGLSENREDRLVAVAPGSEGEDVGGLLAEAERVGQRPACCADYRQMLDEQRPDLVAVAPRFCDHATVALAALERGCHVFVEKPAALTGADLARLRAAQTRAGTHVIAMLGLRYDPAMLAAWQAVRAGRIGTVRLLTAQKSYKLGERAAFFRRRATYGGTIPWVGSHAIDLIAWFAGREFRSVRAAHSAAHNRGHGELEMNALCHFMLADDVAASANIDYLRPAGASTHGDDRIRVAGSDGIVEVRDGQAELLNNEAPGRQTLTPASRGPFFAEVLDFVRGTGDCLLATDDTWRVTDACLRARLAADEDRIVSFTEDLTSC